ncbi:MAG TPA: Ig-like domain repeat protein [Acidobacteriaceae bacterium]
MFRKSSFFAQVLAALPTIGAALLSLGSTAIAHGQATPRITAEVDSSALVSLPGSVHPWARPEFDRGRAPANLSGHMLLVLKRSPEQESALQALIASQQDPKSSNYHKWLTPQEFGKRFGVADSDVQTVTSYLSSQGMSVGRVFSGRMAIEVGATAGQIRSSFQTEIHAYSVGGKTFYANNSAPKIPSALRTVVSGFSALNNFRVEGGSGTGTQATFDPATHTLKPLYTVTTGGKSVYGVSPADLSVIYGIPGPTAQGLGGTNVNVGIVGDSDINVNYVMNYRTIFGLGTTKTPIVVVDGNDPGVNSDAYIAYKQIELVSAVAPNANIYYYTSATTDYDSGIYFALLRAVEDNQVQVLLNGFQECEHAIGTDAMQLVNSVAEEAAAQGITFVAAAGNSGAAGCAVPGTSGAAANAANAVNGFATSPYLTAVGGTDFYYGLGSIDNYWSTTNSTSTSTPYLSVNTNTTNSHKAIGYFATGQYQEQAWNDSYSGNGNSNAVTSPSVQLAGGGGVSSEGTFVIQKDGSTKAIPQPMPPYQLSNANANSIGSGVARVIPDVSFFAGSGAYNTEGYNNTAYIFCMQASDCLSTGTVQFTYSGGTEAASAVFAGAVALAVEQYNAGSRFGLGNVNPALYSQLAGTTPTITAHDIKLGTNELTCSSGTNCLGGHMTGYAAQTGYDAATGLGSFNITSFVTNYKPSNTTSSTVTLAVTDSLGNALSSCVVNGVTEPHCAKHSQWLKFVVNASGSGGTPTGDVAIFTSSPLQSESAVETLTLSSGTASDTWNLLPGGTYNIYARYAGDTTFAPSLTGTPYNITVAPENCQMVVYGHNINVGSSSNIPYGTPVSITVEPYSASTTTNVAIPSGSINVVDNSSQITTLPVDSEGAATFTSNLLATGSHSIVLTYPGNASFNSCSTGAFLANIVQSGTTTVLNPQNPNLNSGSITLTAEVKANPVTINGTTYPSNGTPPSGTVTFKNGATVLGSPTLTPSFDANGNAISAASFTISSVGSGTITATYNGDTRYTTSAASTTLTSSSSTIDINGTSTTSYFITDTDNAANSIYPAQDSLTLHISVPNGTAQFCILIVCFPVNLPSDNGTVSVLANGIPIATGIALDANGNATFTLPQQNGYLTLPTGQVQLSVDYSGYTVTGSFFGIPVNWVSYGASSDTKTITISDDRTNGDFSLQSDTTVNQGSPLLNSTNTKTASYNLRLTSLYNIQNISPTPSIHLTCAVVGYSVGGVRGTVPNIPPLNCGFGSVSTSSVNVTLGSSGYASQTLVVGAGSGYTIASNTEPVQPATRWWMAGGGATLACIFLLGLPARRRKWQTLLGACVMVIATFGMSGCGVSLGPGPYAQDYKGLTGGSSGTPAGTTTPVPAGTYTVLVTATTTVANSTLTHTLPVQVLVGASN